MSLPRPSVECTPPSRVLEQIARPAVIGCIALGMNLRDTLNKFYASDIGTDNELLTKGDPGNAGWLASIQKTDGRCKGHHQVKPMAAAPQPKGKKKKPSKKVRPADDDDDDDIIDDDEGMEMAALKQKPKSTAVKAPAKSKPRRNI